MSNGDPRRATGAPRRSGAGHRGPRLSTSSGRPEPVEGRERGREGVRGTKSPGLFWDGHAHVIGDEREFPFWSGRSYSPAPAPLDAYLAMLDRHGLAHGVLVQPSVYGFDNRCLLDALDRAAGRLFGVVVPSPDATAHDLEVMHQRGIRGVRCNLINPGGLSPDVVLGWEPALHALGWHVELHVWLEDLSPLRDQLERFRVPIVIDHLGRPSPGHADVAALHPLTDLVRAGRCFVKLSAPYRLSAMTPPWRDVTPLIRGLIAVNPRACVWGTDWPHLDTSPAVHTPDLFEVLGEWCPDAVTRQVVMTVAAQTLFTGHAE